MEERRTKTGRIARPVRLSRLCLYKMPSFYLQLHPSHHRSSSSFTHGNAYLCSPCIHSSTPRLHATRRNPPSICNHKEAARLDFACCLVHRWTRQVYFLGSNPSFVLCVPPPYCPYRPMWHFSSIPLPPIPPHPFVCCIDNISLLRMIRIALQSI